MVHTEPKSVLSEGQTVGTNAIDPNGVGHSPVWNSPGDDHEESVASRGVIAVYVPREVIARFAGTLILNELPERKPEIVFDRGLRFPDENDE